MPLTSLLVILLVTEAYCESGDDSTPDPSKFQVWGPGMRSDFHMPVRYFYLQSVDKAGRNLTTRLPDIFLLHIQKVSGSQPPVYAKTDYIGEGIYVFRMRLHYSIEDSDLSIRITYKSHVVISITLQKPLYAEECPCPHYNFTEWTERMGCPKTYSQIENDFDPFPTINMKDVLDYFIKNIYRAGSVAACRYIISNNQIFRKCYGEHVGFHIFSDALLLSITRKVVLPDLDFIWNLGDWPLSTDPASPIPVLSWCGSDRSSDIVMPTYELTESILEMMGRQTVDLFTIMSKTRIPWDKRENKAFFRGRDSSKERLDLVRLSIKKPDLLDARLTNMFFFKNDSTLGQLSKYVPIFDFFKTKYQVNMDGTVSAYRTPYLLAGESVMLKQKSEYYEHFYSMLTENVEYISLEQNISDLMEKVSWLRKNDAKARRIASMAKKFAFHHLSPRDIFCYYARLFERYFHRMRKIDEQESPGSDFVRVTKTDYVRIENCECHRSVGAHDEL